MLKYALATLAVATGLIAYNGHAGLGSAGITDGTSNTIMVGERAVLMTDMGGQFH